MADENKGRRGDERGGAPRGRGAGSGRPGGAGRARDGARDGGRDAGREGAGRAEREGRPERPQRSDRPQRSEQGQRHGARSGSARDGRDTRGGRDGGGGRDNREYRGSAPRDADARPRHDDPVIPDDVAANQLDRAARAELKTLSKDNADWVAKHLVMAARLIDDDPALAHRHALAAGRRAGRIGVVRETTAITAYATGDFALAIRELRTYRRITGRDDQLPLLVDSERGVGRPQQALELGRSVPRAELDPAVQVSLAIAMSGARLDLGQPELALAELDIPQLNPDVAYSYSPELFGAYATVLEELGRADEAEQWWARADRAAAALEEAAVPEGQDTVEIVEEELDDSPEPVDAQQTDAETPSHEDSEA